MVKGNLQGSCSAGPESEEAPTGALTYKAATPKPPLLGEVARRSRDGGVSGLCYVTIPGFFPGLKAQPIEATPQALRASSTHKGMATHTQLKLWFAAHLAGEALESPISKYVLLPKSEDSP